MTIYLESLGSNQFVMVKDINHPRQELLIDVLNLINDGGIALLQGGNNIGDDITVGSIDASNQAVNVRVGDINRVRFGQTQTNINDDLYIGDLATTASAQLHVKSIAGDIFRLDGTSVDEIIQVKADATVNLNVTDLNVIASNDISIVGGGSARLLMNAAIELSIDGSTHAGAWLSMQTNSYEFNIGVDTYLSILPTLITIGTNTAEELRLTPGVDGSTYNIAITSLGSYANDIAADADTNLKSGALYHITGSRVVHRKP